MFAVVRPVKIVVDNVLKCRPTSGWSNGLILSTAGQWVDARSAPNFVFALAEAFAEISRPFATTDIDSIQSFITSGLLGALADGVLLVGRRRNCFGTAGNAFL